MSIIYIVIALSLSLRVGLTRALFQVHIERRRVAMLSIPSLSSLNVSIDFTKNFSNRLILFTVQMLLR